MAFINAFDIFKRSLGELKNIRCVAASGLFIAMFVVLDFFTVSIGGFLKINFAYLALMAVGMLFGPVVGAAVGFICDFAGYLINPAGGAFIPQLALVVALEGFIYGLLLYGFVPQKSLKQILKLLTARAAVVVICNMILNTLILYDFGFIGKSGEGFWTCVYLRIGTNIAGFAAAVVLMPAVLIPIKLCYEKLLTENMLRAYNASEQDDESLRKEDV